MAEDDERETVLVLIDQAEAMCRFIEAAIETKRPIRKTPGEALTALADNFPVPPDDMRRIRNGVDAIIAYIGERMSTIGASVEIQHVPPPLDQSKVH